MSKKPEVPMPDEIATPGKMPELSPEDAAVVETGDAPQEQVQLTDADVIDMGGFDLGGSSESGADAGQPEAGEGATPGQSPTEAAAAPAEPAKETTAKKFKVGSKEFGTPEEVAAYAQQLELERAQAEAYKKGVSDVLKPVETKPAEPEEKIEEIIWEDPKKALELHRKQILKEIEAKNSQKEADQRKIVAQQKAWDDFYAQNPDLKPFAKIVDVEFSQVALDPTTKGLSIPDGFKLVAERARKEVENFKKHLVPADKMPSAPAITSGSSSGKVPQPVVEEKATSFIGELNTMRNRGKLA